MGAPIWLQTIAGVILHTNKVGGHTHLVTQDHANVDTVFKDAARTTAGTTTVVAPPAGTAIIVTDIGYSAEKVSGGTLTICFQDAADSAILKVVNVTDGPADGNINYAGRSLGWKDANLDMVAVGTNINADVTVHYYIVSGEEALSFAEWDKVRSQ